MKKLVCLLFLLLLVVPLAFAVDTVTPATPEMGAWIPVLLYNVVFPFVTAVLLGLVGITLRWLTNKFKLDANEKRDKLIMDAAARGIALAEEKAAAYAKAKGGQMLAGHQKLDIAIGHVVAAVPKVSPEYAEQVVHATLAKIGGVGATGAQVVGKDTP